MDKEVFKDYSRGECECDHKPKIRYKEVRGKEVATVCGECNEVICYEPLVKILVVK
jgi:hypothetical protein